MANASKTWICLALGLLLSACGLFSSATPGARPTLDNAAIRTAAAGTAILKLTESAATTPVDLDAIRTSATPLEPTITPTPRPIPLIAQTIEPAQLPGLLKSSLAVENLAAFDGHALHKIGGWQRGFTAFRWLDANHLVLEPIVGATNEGGILAPVGEWVVMDLRSNRVWIPAAGKKEWHQGYSGSLLPNWSAQLGEVIAARSDHALGIYSVDGALLKTIDGDLLGVSPSGTKLLMADHTWIDLKSGKRVRFAWQMSTDPPTDQYFIYPIWSDDEMRVYACCYHYGNAATGGSQDMPLNDIRIDGKTTQEYFGSTDFGPLYAFYGRWVLNGAYMLVQWGGIWDGSPGFVPLFDPARKTYRSLNSLVDIPNRLEQAGTPTGVSTCARSYAAYGGRYVWLECINADHLVDLATFKSTSYPAYTLNELSWSADGKFALMDADLEYKKQPAQILSGESGKLAPVPEDHYCTDWHPSLAILACGSRDGRTLSLLDAAGMSILKETTLPMSISQMIWSRQGDRIALIAADNSVWQIDFPGLDNLEQLAPSLPGQDYYPYRSSAPQLIDVTWSADDTALALIGDTDVYIIDTK